MNGIATMIVLLMSFCSAAACSCAPAAAGKPAPVLIDGRVLSVVASELGVVATVEVLQNLRGRTPKRITVETTADSASCGVTFREGERRRIPLAPLRDVYATNQCMRVDR